ncbi:MAG: response regulator transcription factor [Bythopirellula sp.]|nr:response regulator transcription factor [Bythopirellula sp.]
MTATKLPLILLAEDDLKTSNLLTVYLEREGYRTIAAYDGQQAIDQHRMRNPDFVVLDVMLPHKDGWEVCREIRQHSEVPVLFLTARDDESDRLLGLGLGADDYVLKPFSPREVVARIKGILRRIRAVNIHDAASDVLTHGALVLDATKRRVSLDGESVELTPIEYTLLLTLMSTPGRVFQRDEIIARLYPHGELVVDRVVDVHVGKLRQKIEVDPADPKYIITVRGTGYRFADRQSEFGS